MRRSSSRGQERDRTSCAVLRWGHSDCSFNLSLSRRHSIKDGPAEGRKNIMHGADLGLLQVAFDRRGGDLNNILSMGADYVHAENPFSCGFIDDFHHAFGFVV